MFSPAVRAFAVVAAAVAVALAGPVAPAVAAADDPEALHGACDSDDPLFKIGLRACRAKGWEAEDLFGAGFLCACKIHVRDDAADLERNFCAISVGKGNVSCSFFFGDMLEHLPQRDDKNQSRKFVANCADGKNPSGFNTTGQAKCCKAGSSDVNGRCARDVVCKNGGVRGDDNKCVCAAGWKGRTCGRRIASAHKVKPTVKYQSREGSESRGVGIRHDFRRDRLSLWWEARESSRGRRSDFKVKAGGKYGASRDAWSLWWDVEQSKSRGSAVRARAGGKYRAEWIRASADATDYQGTTDLNISTQIGKEWALWSGWSFTPAWKVRGGGEFGQEIAWDQSADIAMEWSQAGWTARPSITAPDLRQADDVDIHLRLEREF